MNKLIPIAEAPISKLPKDLDISTILTTVDNGKGLVEYFLEYKKVSEVEQTKRVGIIEYGKTLRSQIEAKKEVLIEVLNQHYHNDQTKFNSLMNTVNNLLLSKDEKERELAKSFLPLIEKVISKSNSLSDILGSVNLNDLNI